MFAKKGQYRTGQDTNKVTKGLYFIYLGRRPHWSDLHQKLCSRWPYRHNHVCQVSKWNFQGLRFYRGSNFPFSYWFLNGPYNSAALLRCLWYQCSIVIISSVGGAVVRSVAISVSRYVYGSVCISARIISKKLHVKTSRKSFLHILAVAVTRSFSDCNAICYVLPVSWMASWFHMWAKYIRSLWVCDVANYSPWLARWRR